MTSSANVTSTALEVTSPSRPALVASFSLYVLPLLVGVAGNVGIVQIIASHKALRTGVNAYIANMAALDLLACALLVPLRIAFYLTQSSLDEGAVALCEADVFLHSLVDAGRMLFLGAISFERYQAVASPFKRDKASAARRAAVTLAVLWAVMVTYAAVVSVFFYDTVMYEFCVKRSSGSSSSSSSSSSSTSWDYGMWGSIEVYFVLPLSLLIVTAVVICYALMFRILHTHRTKMLSHSVAPVAAAAPAAANTNKVAPAQAPSSVLPVKSHLDHPPPPGQTSSPVASVVAGVTSVAYATTTVSTSTSTTANTTATPTAAAAANVGVLETLRLGTRGTASSNGLAQHDPRFEPKLADARDSVAAVAGGANPRPESPASSREAKGQGGADLRGAVTKRGTALTASSSSSTHPATTSTNPHHPQQAVRQQQQQQHDAVVSAPLSLTSSPINKSTLLSGPRPVPTQAEGLSNPQQELEDCIDNVTGASAGPYQRSPAAVPSDRANTSTLSVTGTASRNAGCDSDAITGESIKHPNLLSRRDPVISQDSFSHAPRFHQDSFMPTDTRSPSRRAPVNVGGSIPSFPTVPRCSDNTSSGDGGDGVTSLLLGDSGGNRAPTSKGSRPLNSSGRDGAIETAETAHSAKRSCETTSKSAGEEQATTTTTTASSPKSPERPDSPRTVSAATQPAADVHPRRNNDSKDCFLKDGARPDNRDSLKATGQPSNSNASPKDTGSHNHNHNNNNNNNNNNNGSTTDNTDSLKGEVVPRRHTDDKDDDDAPKKTDAHPHASATDPAPEEDTKGDARTPLKAVKVVEMDGTAHVEQVSSAQNIQGAVCMFNPRNRVQGRRRVEVKVAKRLVIIFLTFLLLWLPYPLAVLTLRGMHTQPDGSPWPAGVRQLVTDVTAVLSALTTVTAAVNPVFYGLANVNIRSVILAKLRGACKFRQR